MPSEHVHAGRHDCMCTGCTVAWVASSSPAIGERGRCWQRLEDRWWWVVGLRTRRIGGLGCGPDLVLAVMKEKQTDLTVTNEPSPLPQLPVLFLSNSSLPPSQRLPHSRTIFFLSALNPYLLHFHLALFQPHFPLSYIFNFTFVLLVMLFQFSITFPILFLAREVLFFCIWRDPATFYYIFILVDYLVRSIDRLIVARNNYFPASVSCHRCS